MMVLLLLAFLGCVYATGPVPHRIIGGQPAAITQYPYMAAMQWSPQGVTWQLACGGALITSKTILSAAHCYEELSLPRQWRTRLGSSFASSGGTVYYVSQLNSHPSYNNPLSYDADVAIVRLQRSVVLSDAVKPVHIAGPNYYPPAGTTVAVMGWGRLQAGSFFPTSEELQHVDVNVISQEICAQRYALLKLQPGYEAWPDVTPGMLCSGILDVGGKDACQGDSGGPLAFTNDPTVGHVVVGVTSWGFGCADAHYPGVNARVSQYSDWIVFNGAP